MVVTERKPEGEALGALIGLDVGSLKSSRLLVGEAVLADLDILADLEATGGLVTGDLVTLVDLFLADLATRATVESSKMALDMKMMVENLMVVF